MDKNSNNISDSTKTTVCDLVKPQQMKKVSGWTSLASFPSNICIDGQNPTEYILLFVREHKIILFFNVLLYIFIFFMPQFLRATISYLDTSVLNGAINSAQFFESKWWVIILFCWVAYTLTGFFNIFFKWFYNINILTTERFLDIDLETIFTNRVESATLLDIEDVKDTQIGIIQSIFNMGDLTMLTASGGTIFNLHNVPKAHKIRDFIMDVTIKAKELRGGND